MRLEENTSDHSHFYDALKWGGGKNVNIIYPDVGKNCLRVASQTAKRETDYFTGVLIIYLSDGFFLITFT